MDAQSILIAIVVGLVVALIVTGVLRAGLKSVGKQDTAVFYEKDGGLQLTRKNDIFMYKNTERYAKPKEQSNGPRPGGQRPGGPQQGSRRPGGPR